MACLQAEQTGLQVRRSCGDALERDFPWGVALQLFAPRRPVGGDPSEQPEEAELFQGQAVLAQPLLHHALVAGSAPADPFPLVHGLYWVAVNLAPPPPAAGDRRPALG